MSDSSVRSEITRRTARSIPVLQASGQRDYIPGQQELGVVLTEKGFSPPHATPLQRQW